MESDSSRTVNYQLEKQIYLLSQLTEEIHASLIQDGSEDIDAVLEDLAQLTSSLSHLGNQVAIHEEERNSHIALADISQVVNSSLQLDDVLRIVMDTIIRLTGAERGFLMLKDSQGELSIHIARNWEQESLDPSDTALSKTVVNQVLAGRGPILTTNALQDPRFDAQESVISLSLRSILCVPLILKETLIGVIYADNRLREGLFTETQKNLLATFANQAAVAIENARLFESVRRTLSEVTELKSLMDDVFASIASGVITTDLDHRITLTNSVVEDILEDSQENLLGKTVDQVPLLKQINLSRYLTNVRQSNHQVRGLQFNIQPQKRKSLNLRFNLSPLEDATGKILGTVIVMEDETETHRLEAQRRLFERMVSPVVIDQLNPDELNLGGTRTFITTLFADIRGYTSLSERCDPETLVSVLNRYLGAATDAILLEEGTIDKFMGDAIMAFFNAPIPQSDHTLRAVRAAVQMRDAVNSIQGELPPELRLELGIGIHSGEAVLGLVGTQKRLEYTAIGDSVNTAKRLQENAAPGQILITAGSCQHIIKSIQAYPIDPLNAKGKKQLLQVYEVKGLTANNPASPA
ncbi:MAG: adenylate/guanylate cyclase domain-containing protein [Anaerolineales bacterium]